MLTSSDAIIERVRIQLQSIASKVTDDGYDEAVRVALGELNVTLPVDDVLKERWIVFRTKRHAVDILRSQAADKFKFDTINLQNKFDQYNKLITAWDEDWEKFKEENPTVFDIDGSWGTDIFTYFPANLSGGR